MKRQFPETISNEAMAALPLIQFEGKIVVVDRTEGIVRACDELMAAPVIGFDTETKPVFQAGVVHKTALLQLATPDTCYLFRLSKIALERPLLRLLENPSVLKIGVAVRDDLKNLRSLRHFRPEGFVELPTLVGVFGIAEKSVRKLSSLVLGGRISKQQRLTNWDADLLTSAQQLYAATDAWVVLKIYLKLKEEESQLVTRNL